MRGKENAPADARQGVLEEQARIEKLESENYELKLKIRMFERKYSANVTAAPKPETSDKQLETEIARLQERNVALEKENNSLREQILALPTKISSKYQKQVDDFFERVRADLIAKRRLEVRIAELEDERGMTNSSPKDNQTPPDSPLIDQLNRDLAASRVAKMQLEAQLTELHSQCEEAATKSKRLQEELDSVKADLLAAKTAGRPDSHEARRDPHSEAELERLRIAHDDANFENSYLKGKIKHMEQNLEELDQQLRMASKRSAEAPSSQDMEEKYRQQIRRLEIQLANSRQEIESSIAPHELAVAKEDLSRAQIGIAELEAEKKALADKLRAMTVQHEITENRLNDLKKREVQRKDSEMRVLSQKSQLEKDLANARLSKITLEEKTQALETNLLREARARQTTENRNTELEHALSRTAESTRVLQSSRMHLSQLQNSVRDNERTRRLNLDNLSAPIKPRSVGVSTGELSQEDEMEALKTRLGINSESV